MAVNVQPGATDISAEDTAAMRAEIRRGLEEMERLHQQAQRDDARAEASSARRRALLDQLKADLTAAFGKLGV